LLGYIGVPRNQVRLGGQFVCALPERTSMGIAGDLIAIRRLSFTVDRIIPADENEPTYLAVKSDDYPIEDLRRLPGFREAE
jgi:hypothetical protein